MAWYNVAQGAAFLIAAAVAWQTPRAVLWVSMLAVSYIISVSYLKLAPSSAYWPPSQLVGLFLDGIVLLAIREYHKEQREFYGLGTIMAFMVTADTIQLFGVLTGFPPPFSEDNFGIVLEVLNYLALALIGGFGLKDRMSVNDDTVAHHRFNILSRTCHHAHTQTDKPRSLRKW